MFRGRQVCQRVSETYRSPYEVTSIVDTDCVCGGHRGSGAMAGDAEVVGGGCGFGTFGWWNYVRGIFIVTGLGCSGVGFRAGGVDSDWRAGF